MLDNSFIACKDTHFFWICQKFLGKICKNQEKVVPLPTGQPCVGPSFGNNRSDMLCLVYWNVTGHSGTKHRREDHYGELRRNTRLLHEACQGETKQIPIVWESVCRNLWLKTFRPRIRHLAVVTSGAEMFYSTATVRERGAYQSIEATTPEKVRIIAK